MKLAILKKAKEHLSYSGNSDVHTRKWTYICIAIEEAAEQLYGDSENNDQVSEEVVNAVRELQEDICQRMGGYRGVFTCYLARIMDTYEYIQLTPEMIQVKRHAFLSEMIKDYGG